MGKVVRSREKMRNHSNRLRAAGLRPLLVWVPDSRLPGFAEEARRQSLLVSRSAAENEALDFIEAAADTDGWQ
ncbi:antitoxin MazE family protein [Desulforhabdus sp. TSK]|uniref:antitoxin MazE family protein n=1 Tax=Desulforhabdus sp. TSK TaxID=2925014 RepID=UPI002082E992|nr:hypothetical protein DSTSK_11600 [Desulforhabdus sp. TSK]